MLLQERELARHNYSFGKVRSAEHGRFTIVPNTERVIQGYLCKPIVYKDTCAVVQPTKNSAIPPDLDIAPTIVDFHHDEKIMVQVHVSNVATRTVSIPTRALLCELQVVSIEDLPAKTPTQDEGQQAMDLMDFNEADVTPEQLRLGKETISQFLDVFSTGEEQDIGHVTTVKHRIDLEDDRPFKQRHRRIPPAMYQEVKEHLQQLFTSGVIRHSFSPWSSNVVLVRKKSGKLRMCVDFRQQPTDHKGLLLGSATHRGDV
ncbi:uncharacterized protein LOC124260534 [Haliotis rubra]|uniref:uncharacterized protein LOC124260534 n=1 Tax=Haliotis rubra TaxID=36100 RepID=UPI001EE5F050|nr:uncharacterized protein LOC124260534 [Haliotis rubra]